MCMTRHEKIGTTRVARHRAAMRAKGYRLRQIWVPDTRSDAFRQQAAADCRAINAAQASTDDLEFAEAVRYWPESD